MVCVFIFIKMIEKKREEKIINFYRSMGAGILHEQVKNQNPYI